MDFIKKEINYTEKQDCKDILAILYKHEMPDIAHMLVGIISSIIFSFHYEDQDIKLKNLMHSIAVTLQKMREHPEMFYEENPYE